jgi:hypothetical protein
VTSNGFTVHLPDYIYEYGVMVEKLVEKPVPVPLLTTKHPKWTDPGTNSGLCGERLVTNHLSHSTALLVK